jgi:hypothetical protein
VVSTQFSPGIGDTAPLQRVGPTGPPPKRPVGKLIKGAGLVGVAVVSSLLWWLIRHQDPQAAVAQPPAKVGTYDFTLAGGPVVSTDCASNSYGKTKAFFSAQPCTRLSRALYLTTSGGAEVLVSVVLVTMPDAAQAQQLKTLTDQDNTGNVNDLVKDGTTKIAGAPNLAVGQYASATNGPNVTIVLAQFFDHRSDKPSLTKITADATRLAGGLR